MAYPYLGHVDLYGPYEHYDHQAPQGDVLYGPISVPDHLGKVLGTEEKQRSHMGGTLCTRCIHVCTWRSFDVCTRVSAC